jgi:hypothetical protein
MSVFCIHCNSTGVIMIAAYISANQWGKEKPCPRCANRRLEAQLAQDRKGRGSRMPLCEDCGEAEAAIGSVCWDCQFNRT